MLLASYMTFRESSNRHQIQGISQISLNVEYSQFKYNLMIFDFGQAMSATKKPKYRKLLSIHVQYKLVAFGKGLIAIYI